MAATKRNGMLIAEARQKIQTTQLINRLQDHAFGTVELTQTQVRAVEILLRKSVPDLATVTHQGDDNGGPVLIATGVAREPEPD
jgi:hypothetical protein